jgi:asparagine synthase (glutamine-hydrolysing)
MCGIVGTVHFDGSPPDRQLLQRMLQAIRHRGPDASGVHVEGPAGLAHARLSIIDLQGGQQPMPNEDGSLWVTFNGEIFNYLELREALQAEGHRFATRSDTEVILHAYEEYGEDCVRQFNGQWAFAVWDNRRKTLFLSRDRLGVRPLYYTTAGKKFLFASEVKSLLVHPEVVRGLDPLGLDQVFTFWSTLPPRTVFRGIFELPPGHNLVVRDQQLRSAPHWQLNYDRCDQSMPEAECAERLLDLLTDATRLRLRSDVPVGAYLSGGLDSTVTTALARRSTTGPLRTFSITFDDAEFDESHYQRLAVDALQTDHEMIHCRLEDIGRVFPDVIWHAERPVLRTAPAPMYLLSELVRSEGFKVVLTGEGADETLGGYDIFKEAKVRRFWAARPESDFRARLLQRLYPYLPNLRAQSLAYRKAFFHVRPEDLASPFFSHLPRWELTARLKLFFSAAMQAELADHDAYAECLALLPAAYARWHPFCQAQYLESATLLPGYILSSQGDRMAMAHSVEGRYPFLDHRVVEFAAAIPRRMKMRGLDEKHILKRAAAGLVPPAVLERTKQPYRAPDAKCFFSSSAGGAPLAYVEELLSPRRIRDDGIFQPEAVERLVQKVRRGLSIGVKDNMALVGILSTQLVIDRFLRSSAPPDAATESGAMPTLAWACSPSAEETGHGPAIPAVPGSTTVCPQ